MAILLAATLATAVVPARVAIPQNGADTRSVQVQPATVDAGETVDIVGTGLEPDSDRDLVLAGGDMVIDFGVVKTDASGGFSKELQVPSHLPTGTYELRAVGDETLVASLSVTGAATALATPATGAAPETAVASKGVGWEDAAFFAFVAVVLSSGSFLVWKVKSLSRTLERARR